MRLVDHSGNPIQRGCLRVVCRQEADMILVEIWNDGRISQRSRTVPEPFFTTKGPGQG